MISFFMDSSSITPAGDLHFKLYFLTFCILPGAQQRRGDGDLVAAAARWLAGRAEGWLKAAAAAAQPVQQEAAPGGKGGGAA